MVRKERIFSISIRIRTIVPLSFGSTEATLQVRALLGARASTVQASYCLAKLISFRDHAFEPVGDS